MKTKKEMRSNEEIHKRKQLLGVLKLVGNNSLVFLNYGYNVLTKTWYKVQISSKIIDFDGYQNL